jgi:hypothetical protein
MGGKASRYAHCSLPRNKSLHAQVPAIDCHRRLVVNCPRFGTWHQCLKLNTLAAKDLQPESCGDLTALVLVRRMFTWFLS